jgi:hypothetical protein
MFKSDLAPEQGAASTCLKSVCVTRSGQARYCSHRAGSPGPIARRCMLVNVKSDLASHVTSHVTCHVSHVTCHVTRDTCHMSLIFSSFLDKVVKLTGGGSVINGAYPV